MMRLLSNGYYDPFFDDIFSPIARDRKVDGLMRTDVEDLGDDYLMEIELPGVEKSNIGVEYEKGYVTISVVENKETENNVKRNYVMKERKALNMSRSFYVGEIDENDIKAEMKDGILALTIPKEDKKKLESKKKIEIC